MGLQVLLVIPFLFYCLYKSISPIKKEAVKSLEYNNRREGGKTESFDFQLTISYRLPVLPAEFDF
jgi:hypothetical protein